MWHRVNDEGFSVGDPIEILGRFLENEPCIGKVVEIRFHKPSGRLHYTIESRELVLPRPFLAEDLRRLEEKVHLRASDFQTAVGPAPSRADGGANGELNLQTEIVEKPTKNDRHNAEQNKGQNADQARLG
jgi:hypothetical protein